MRRLTSALILVMLPLVVQAWPWSQDMMNQPSVKPQEGKMTPFPSRSVPVTGFPTKVRNREEAKPLQSPIPVTDDTLRKGRDLFKIYCGACHGLTGKAARPDKRGSNDLSVRERWLVVNYVKHGLVQDGQSPAVRTAAAQK